MRFVRGVTSQAVPTGNNLLANLASVWEFNGDATDSHGSNNLTAIGAPSYVAALLGNGVDLQSSGPQYFTRAGLLSGSPSAFSFSCWFKPDNVTQDMALFHDGDANTFNHRGFLFLDDVSAGTSRTDCIRFGVYSTNNGNVAADIDSPSGAIIAGSWHHVVAVFQGGSTTGLRLYINNVEVADSPVSTINVTTVNNVNATVPTFYIGKNSAIDDYPDAVFDQFAMWVGRALSSADVASLYNSGAGLAYSSWT